MSKYSVPCSRHDEDVDYWDSWQCEHTEGCEAGELLCKKCGWYYQSCDCGKSKGESKLPYRRERRSKLQNDYDDLERDCTRLRYRITELEAERDAHAAGPWCADWSQAPAEDVLVWDAENDFWVLEYANGYYYDGAYRHTRERLQDLGAQWAHLHPPKEDA